MIHTSRAGVIAALALPIAIVVAACGGTAATTTPTPTPAGATPAGATPAGATPAGATPGDSIAFPSFDLSQLGGAIPGLDSYRVEVTTDGTKQYENVVVTQPELSKAITTFKDDGTVDTRYIVIGKKAWQADGTDGRFEEVPDALAQSMLLAFDPALLFQAFGNANWTTGSTDQGVESKNGIQARHLKIDGATFLGGAAQLPAGTSIDVWVADAGYLIALEIVENGTMNLGVEVSGVNDPANRVEAP